MLTRRALVSASAATAAAFALPAVAYAGDDGFIRLTNDGEFMTCKLPASETIVEVKLLDGSIARAMFDCPIMEPGDWDFATATADDELGDDSLADQVIAWRPIQEATPRVD